MQFNGYAADLTPARVKVHLPAHRPRQYLMAETNAQKRHLRRHHARGPVGQARHPRQFISDHRVRPADHHTGAFGRRGQAAGFTRIQYADFACRQPQTGDQPVLEVAGLRHIFRKGAAGFDQT
jgi:hypothetical protein